MVGLTDLYQLRRFLNIFILPDEYHPEVKNGLPVITDAEIAKDDIALIECTFSRWAIDDKGRTVNRQHTDPWTRWRADWRLQAIYVVGRGLNLDDD